MLRFLLKGAWFYETPWKLTPYNIHSPPYLIHRHDATLKNLRQRVFEYFKGVGKKRKEKNVNGLGKWKVTLFIFEINNEFKMAVDRFFRWCNFGDNEFKATWWTNFHSIWFHILNARVYKETVTLKIVSLFFHIHRKLICFRAAGF